MAGDDDDDVRHRREEAERRAKRKAAKSSRSGSEKDRKRREHAQRVLKEQNKYKKQKVDSGATPSGGDPDSSVFQSLFAKRAQGFRIDFAFRNAPPRPPVGPCFIGLGLEGHLQDYSLYRPLNAVEVNYTWKLHTEPDLGVPLAPSAMDLKCYNPPSTDIALRPLHPDDEKLLDWKGSKGDTAAEELQKRRDRARAEARLALAGKAVPTTSHSNLPTKKKSNKHYSRVLDENLQSFMKKTTYLSNDYTRKVHDFTSLAKTKQKTEQEIQAKQKVISQQRSAESIEKSFKAFVPKHPTKPTAKPVWDIPLLPNVDHWGHTFTHVVIDNPPKKVGAYDQSDTVSKLGNAFVAHVERPQATARMTCELMVPAPTAANESTYRALQRYDLDVVPLKEEDEPHANFVLWLSSKEATYLPIPSRVQLSTGRPSKKANTISRRSMNPEDKREMQERIAEVDMDMANKVRDEPPPPRSQRRDSAEDDDDDYGDGGYDNYDNDGTTIVAG